MHIYANSYGTMLTAARLSLFDEISIVITHYARVTDPNVSSFIFTCVSYAEARLSYRLDVTLSVCLSVRLSVRHTLVLYQNGLTYCHAFFTTR